MSPDRIETAQTRTDRGQRGYFWGLAVLVVSVVVVAAWPSSADGPTVTVDGDSWIAVPASIVTSAESHTISMINEGTRTEAFAVLRLSVAPDALPIRNYGPDMWHEGGEFQVVYPAYEHIEGEGVTPNPLEYDTIEPGQEKEITIGNWKGAGGPGTYLVTSSQPGAYESGMYAVYTLADA